MAAFMVLYPHPASGEVWASTCDADNTDHALETIFQGVRKDDIVYIRVRRLDSVPTTTRPWSRNHDDTQL